MTRKRTLSEREQHQASLRAARARKTARNTPGKIAPWLMTKVAELDKVGKLSDSRVAFLTGSTRENVREARRQLADRIRGRVSASARARFSPAQPAGRGAP
jgi:hypothetical protein